MQTQTAEAVGIERYRKLPSGWRALAIAFGVASIFLAVNQLLNLGFFVGYTILTSSYLYLIGALLVSLVFLLFPACRKAPRDRVPWYDALLFAVTAGTFGYFAWNGTRIVQEGWEFAAPAHAIGMSYLGLALLLEVIRRAGGTVLFLVVLFFALYPAFAGHMPGPIAGLPQPLPMVAAYHFASSESVMGIPFRAFGELVIGFIMFGAALQYTGAGTFFNNIALALFGALRGGPAKVAIFASGLMGSVSGSAVSNVLTTGVVTIPAMKRIGFAPAYAGAVEACASTGGVLMPPIMGATAFVMASFLGIPYLEVAIAALAPSLLFYFGLFMQIDAYAARKGLKGLPRAELPSIRRTFREGWYYLAVFAVLVYMLVALQREALAPFYATAVLLAINQFSPKNRIDRRGLTNLLAGITASLAELAGLLAGIGLIVGAFSVTGLAGTLANDLVYLAGDAPLVLLVMGAITSFVFGMGMTITACYIFLVIVLAPPLTAAGFEPIAVHLFMLYFGMISFITPPVALASFAAAGLAGASPMRVGLEAMRLGMILYVVPFFFVYNPALLLRGSPGEVAIVVGTAVLGVLLISAALQGNLLGVGNLGNDALGWIARLALFAAGLMFATPGGGDVPFTHAELALGALVVGAPGVLIPLLRNRPKLTRARV
ncbi:MAG TPA: TRAP transporter fused permease subunit [Burkholderiales bacterium]